MNILVPFIPWKVMHGLDPLLETNVVTLHLNSVEVAGYYYLSMSCWQYLYHTLYQ